MEKQQRDAIMKQKMEANTKKAAAQKAEAIRTANKVVSDAQKTNESLKRAQEAKNKGGWWFT